MKDLIELNETLLQRNIHHFAQSKDTPFNKEPLKSLFPTFEPSPEIDQQLLHGNLTNLPPLPPYIISLFQAISTLNCPTPISDDLQSTVFKDGMQKISKGKASPMSERHHGLYKALLPHDFTINIMVKLINICKNSSILLTRWKK